MLKRTRLKRKKRKRQKVEKDYNPYAGRKVYKYIRKHSGVFGTDAD